MSQKDPLIGKTLEKCRLLEKLGTGGMGSVYLAEHFGLGRKVAVKILPPDMSRDPEYVARFMREATTAGRLEHPNIVQIYDVGYAEDRHFIVMQFVEGESLSTAVEALGAMEPRDAAQVVAGVLRGLHHAHEHGVVHRDVKPDNILLAKGDQPKLLDFGLAIETEGALQLTKDGLVVGTPYYLSPEQARGQRATPKSDVYAAGVLLYFLVTGKRPFVGATALAVLNKHIREKAVPPMAQNPKVPKPLNDIVLKMMSKRPEDRYASAGAAADDLENFLADRPVTARITEAPPWLTPQVRIAGLSAAGFLAIVATIALVARSCGGPPPGPAASSLTAGGTGPVTAPERPPVGSLETIIKLDVAGRDNPAAWRGVVREYEAYILANAGTRHADEARRRLDAFQQEIEARAQEILRQLPAGTDKIRRVEALDALPTEALDLTSAGATVRSERARLADDLRKQYGEQKGQLDRAIEEGDFDLALALVNTMLRYAEPSRKQALLSLRAELPEREARYRDPALRRLSQEYARVRGTFEAALLQRKPGEAYAAVTRFLLGCKESGEQKLTRVKGVNYDGLLAIGLDSTLDPYRLAEARAAVERPWGTAESTLAYEILADLQDAIDLEWLLRKAGAALRALLASPGAEVSLATFGGPGRVALGPAGFVFQPKGGQEQALSIPQLVPVDLVSLAAKDENQTVDAAFQTNAPLARAAGVCYRYSEGSDRWSGAARWFTRAAELKAAGPPGRPEAMRELGRRQVRERLTLAQKDVAERRHEAAKKALAELEAQAGKDKELLDEVGRVAAAVLSAELRQAFEERGSARVKELARLLRDRYPGLYDEDAIAGLYRRVLWNTSDWIRIPTDPAGGYWDWEGKAKGAPAPASNEAHEGIRLAAGKRLFLNPSRAGGISGLRVQVRLNAEAANFSVGFHFDVARPEGKYRTFVLTPRQAGFGEGSEVGARLRHAGPLKKKPAPGEWISLAFVAEGGDLAGYVEGEPVAGCRGELSPRGGIALAADVDANFRVLDVRK